MMKKKVLVYETTKKFTRVLVISDTHQHIGNAITVITKGNYDHIIHLGDLVSDAQDLSNGFPEIPVHFVKGNCDFYDGAEPDILELTINGCKIIACHGHQFSVKHSTDRLEKIGAQLGGHIILYGHSHKRYESWVELQKSIDKEGRQREILLMNPGSISLPRDGKSPSFGLLEIEANGRFHHSFGEYKNFNKNC